MAIMNDATRKKVRDIFAKELQDSLEIMLFHDQGAGDQEQFTDATREIIGELAALADGKVSVRDLAIQENAELVQQYGVDKFPALVFLDGQGRDRGMRFYGAPVGYEFMALLEDIVDLSKDLTRLSDAVRDQIKAIQKPVVIQVFSTPT